MNVRDDAVARSTRGTVTVEYTVLLILVGIAGMTAMQAVGPLLLGLFRFQRALLLLPFP